MTYETSVIVICGVDGLHLPVPPRRSFAVGMTKHPYLRCYLPKCYWPHPHCHCGRPEGEHEK